jgi:hypothetical protein
MVEPETAQAPPAGQVGGRTPEGSSASRCNALRDGCRSRVIFGPEMSAAINERMARLSEQLEPEGELQSMIYLTRP